MDIDVLTGFFIFVSVILLFGYLIGVGVGMLIQNKIPGMRDKNERNDG